MSAKNFDYEGFTKNIVEQVKDLIPKNFNESQKEFIKAFMDFKNLDIAAMNAGIDVDTAKYYYTSFDIQNEMKRLNKAIYQRQFAKKLLTIDDIGGYLSSLLTDEHVAVADRLTIDTKLKVADMILKINQFKQETMYNPAIVIDKDINEQIKDLSVGALKQLISQTKIDNTSADKDDIINKLNIDNSLTDEEKKYLSSLPVDELLKLLNDITNNKEEK